MIETTLVPPQDREPVPAFVSLSGFRPGDDLRPDELRGRIAVVNAWFEW
jgi:hypothetical protein